MYSVDEKDRVVPIKDIPQSSVGAPIPIVLSDEFVTVVAFYLQNTPDDWDGTSIRIIGKETESETLALVRFFPCYASIFGPPNDEAFTGHPLENRGLRPYGAFIIENSSWIRRLEQMNSVHPCHKPERFWERILGAQASLPACFGQSVIAGNPAGKDACAPRMRSQDALPDSLPYDFLR